MHLLCNIQSVVNILQNESVNRRIKLIDINYHFVEGFRITGGDAAVM